MPRRPCTVYTADAADVADAADTVDTADTADAGETGGVVSATAVGEGGVGAAATSLRTGESTAVGVMKHNRDENNDNDNGINTRITTSNKLLF